MIRVGTITSWRLGAVFETNMIGVGTIPFTLSHQISIVYVNLPKINQQLFQHEHNNLGLQLPTPMTMIVNLGLEPRKVFLQTQP